MSNLDRSMNIDTEVLNEEKDKLIKTKEKLEEILSKVKKSTNDLKNYWDSATSESVFTNFDEMYKYYEDEITNLNNDIEFLNKTIEEYHEYEEKAEKVIENNLAN